MSINSITLQHDIVRDGQMFLFANKEYSVEAVEPNKNKGKVNLVIHSEVSDEDILIEVDIE